MKWWNILDEDEKFEFLCECEDIEEEAYENALATLMKATGWTENACRREEAQNCEPYKSEYSHGFSKYCVAWNKLPKYIQVSINEKRCQNERV
jgi:hypothetical protein|tara:strand:- start:148 stop:426 length:279 start_codon:yes stop_codon:yes gene_type:complete